MATRSTINVSLTPELQAFVAAKVATGRYQSASEVIREALRILEQDERSRKEALRRLRQDIAVGVREAKRGELLDGEEVFREVLPPGGRRRRAAG